MEYVEYLNKLHKIEDRRKNYFKKINKCDNDIRNLKQNYFFDNIGYRNGDCYIYDNNGTPEYLKILRIEAVTDNEIIISFGKCNDRRFIKSRNIMDRVYIYANKANNWKLPEGYKKTKP